MIQSFKHKGLRQYFESESTAGIQGKHAQKLRLVFSALDTASTINDMDIPGFNLHPLKGNRKGEWAVSVSGNWRITFNFKNGNSTNINYEDYH